MSVRVIQRSYEDRFSPNEPTDWLLGNVGDWQKAIFTVDAAVQFFASDQQPIRMDEINNTFVLVNGQKWGDIGFDAGMNITFEYKLEIDTNNDGTFDNSTTITQNFTVENIFGTKLVVNQAINTSDFTQIPLRIGSRRVIDVRFFSTAAPEGVKMQFTHLTNSNSESQNLTSFIDSSVTEFVAPNLSASGAGDWIDMFATGLQSGMSVRSARVRRLMSSDSESYGIANIPAFSNVLTSVSYRPSINRIIFQNARAIPMTVTGTQSSYFKSVAGSLPIPTEPTTDGGPPTVFQNGNAASRFIANVPANVTHQIAFNISFKVTNVENTITTPGDNTIRVTLFRYTNNDSMNFAERITLREWVNVETMIGQTLNYNEVITRNMLAGESYVVALEYNQNTFVDNRQTLVGYSVEQGVVQLSQPDQNFTVGVRNRYQFEIQYMISSFFETAANIQNRQIPSYLQNDGSLTDNARFTFLPEWNNPNISISNVLSETARKGNTGWFDENFNQAKNNFRVTSIRYTDLNGNQVNAIDYTKKTRVQVKVAGVKNIGTNTICGIGFAWIPQSEDDVREKTTPFYQNTFVQSGDLDQGFGINTTYVGPYVGAGVNGGSMNMENVSIKNENDILVFEMVFSPNPAFISIFEGKNSDDRNYALYVSVSDSSLQRRYSDRVTLLVDYRSLVKTLPPAGPYPNIENLFLEHPDSETNLGTSKLNAITQDDMLARMPFRIPNDGSTIFNSITFGVEMSNPGLNRTFDLETYSVDVSQSQRNDNGVQQFSVNETRGFRLPAGNNKNWVRVEKGTGDTSTLESFIAYYAFRMRWEDWQANTNVPQDFFNSSLPNNGLNNDWVNYVTKSGWQINFFTRINAVVNGEAQQYKNTWGFNLQNYDSNSRILTTHNYFRNSDNTNINAGADPDTGRPLGVVLSNEETRVEIAYTIQDSGTFDLSDYYGIITIEVDQGQGQFGEWELTSVWDRQETNPLKGVASSARLTMEISANNKTITTKAIIDPNLLENAERYRITGRLGCAPSDGTFSQRIYTNQYAIQYA